MKLTPLYFARVSGDRVVLVREGLLSDDLFLESGPTWEAAMEYLRQRPIPDRVHAKFSRKERKVLELVFSCERREDLKKTWSRAIGS